MTMTDSNLDQAISSLPKFSELDIAKLVSDLSQLIENSKLGVDKLFENDYPISWDGIVRPLEDYSDRLSKFFSPFSHLHNVADTSALREAYNEALPMLSEYANEYAQDQRIFQAYEALAKRDEEENLLTQAQKQVVSNALRDFRLSGYRAGRRNTKARPRNSSRPDQARNNVRGKCPRRDAEMEKTYNRRVRTSRLAGQRARSGATKRPQR